jgi:hypothetical protein
MGVGVAWRFRCVAGFRSSARFRGVAEAGAGDRRGCGEFEMSRMWKAGSIGDVENFSQK